MMICLDFYVTINLMICLDFMQHENTSPLLPKHGPMTLNMAQRYKIYSTLRSKITVKKYGKHIYR